MQKSELVSSCLEPNIDLKVLGCEDSVCFDEVGGVETVVSQQVSQRGLVGIGIGPRPWYLEWGWGWDSWLPYSTYLYLDFHLFHDKAKRTQQGDMLGLGYQGGWDWTTPFLISPPWKDSPSQTENNRSMVLQLSHICFRLLFSHPINHSLRKNFHPHLICSRFQAKISKCGEIN